MALVLVLGTLVLLSAIVIGFLATVRQDRTSSAYYESGTMARQYADTAVTVAIAQIAEATSNPDLSWISQPGLLRTFDANGPVAAYKLYSSDAMKVTGAYNPEVALSNEVPANWSTRPDEFTDLNKPVEVTIGGAPQSLYPIVDPAATNDVEGFTLDTGVSGVSSTTLPMPVRWIYVRKNGDLVDYNTARSVDDITARIAFWGDDETCKVNINTASDAPYHDTPVAHTKQDHDLGRFQPIAQEYQRYPGHPATTSLASVIKELRDDTDVVSRSQKASAITPRVGWGGSAGGTVQAWITRNVGTIDFDRLYPGVDELKFSRDASGNWMSGTTRNAPSVDLNLKRLPFFLTTESRGPELNVFNRPRITLWPFNKELIDGDSAATPKLTPEDRLIRFASEIGVNRRKLYFQREDAWDPSNDYTNIQENKDLYAYLQWLTQKPFPGNANRTGGSSASLENKFSAIDRDQIITLMFDYLRSQVNTMNRSYEPVNGPMYSFPQGHDLNNTGFNDQSPILINAGNGLTKGLGSGGVTLTEFIMQFYNATTRATSPNSEELRDFFNNTTGLPVPDGKMDTMIRKVQMVILLNYWMSVNNLNTAMPRFQVELIAPHLFVNPNPYGVPADLTDTVFVRYKDQDDTAWTTNAIDLGLPTQSTNLYFSNHAQFDSAANNLMGGALGLRYGFMYQPLGKAISTFVSADSAQKVLDGTASGDLSKYPFASRVLEFRIPIKLDSSGNPTNDPITGKPAEKSSPTVAGIEGVPTASGPMNGSPATVTMYPGLETPADPNTLKNAGATSNLQTKSNNNYLQKVDLVIANALFPLPRLGPDSTLTGTSTPAFSPRHKYSDLSDYSKRLEYKTATPSDVMMLVPTGLEGGNSWLAGGTQTMASMDSFRSYSLATNLGSQGDFRLAALRRDVPSQWFAQNPSYNDAGNFMGMDYLPAFLTRGYGSPLPDPIRIGSSIASSNPWGAILPKISSLVQGVSYNISSDRTAGAGVTAATKSNNSDGDFTNGYGSKGDGGMVKGPDIGAISRDATKTPYYYSTLSRSGDKDSLSETGIHQVNYTGLVYSPWKQMPSAVRFGTLPSRALDGDPWETLLFNPVPAGTRANHRGWTALPRDHYWLDLFYMPVVEPYAITENFATNGKINLNSQIAPFTYIRRNTGLWALLRNMKVLAIPTSASSSYKSANLTHANAGTEQYRRPVDIGATVAQIEERLKLSNDPFVSASEITEIPMLFDGQSAANIENYWNSYKISGDDSREAPYNAIYPRVTTRSNTYKIHFFAQTLKGRGGKWTVAGQYRGSQTVERYLDGFSGETATRTYGTGSQPDAQFPALAGSDGSGVPFYRFRKLNHQQFAP